jgi:5-methylcytosine-specific restriction endonuclease McrA
MGLNGQVLLLNANFELLKVVSMQRAIQLMLRDDNPGRLELATGHLLHSAGGMEIAEPSVLVLTHYKSVRENIRKANVERLKVFVRYGFRCGYCGKKFPQRQLTRDHVVPKSKGGQTTPENLAASCKPCNNRKADCTPKEANMPLLLKPKALNIGTSRVLAHSLAEKYPAWANYLYLGKSDARFEHTGG